MSSTYKAISNEEADTPGLLTGLGWIAVLALSVLSTILCGKILHDLWAWFVVPLGIRPIGIVQAMGLSVTAAFFLRGVKRVSFDSEGALSKYFEGLIFFTLSALILWGCGAIYAFFL